jgi:photosystem II stability/assembly factor-like uncharacterized protein
MAGIALVLGAGAVLAQDSPLTTEALDALEPREIGPATMSGRIVDLAVIEADPTVFYLATATGGVWKTVNNGVTFQPVFQDEATHSVGDIAVHQGDTAVVWVGTGERASRQSSSWGDGVYKSTDGGKTWDNKGLRDSHHIGRITLHPNDPDIAYVAAMGHLWGPNDERGLYKTTDGGDTWERILHVDENTGAVDVQLDPKAPNVLYAATYQRRRRPYGFHGGGPGSALWKSMDAGASWTKLTNAGLDNGLPTGDIGRIGISVYWSDPRIVYASVEQGFRYNASTAYNERRAGLYRSEDHGETWELMSDWNPRPMYASQPLVDPNDDQRVYMLNSFSYSDDGGRSFTAPRNRTHGDDRLVWVNRADSRHVMKADDGGLGISYDRAQSWLYVTNLPVSQWYRVRVDNAVPFNVYGGLQDNGSWAGPSATYRSEGIINEDWVKWGGGDGFLNVVDTTNNRILYTESQYLGLSRVDMVTGERKSIRPGAPEGFIGARRNWETWKDVGTFEEQRLGNAMPPANWDGPFLISPHDANTIYAGTNILWKSTDRGDRWAALGDRTTGVDRRTLAIMGELPREETLSLDDGIPYYPGLTIIAESPLQQGLLYVGTDDGNVQVSRDDGATWAEVSDRVPGLPDDAWVSGIEPSAHVDGRVYAVFNNYRNDDFANYVYRSDDFGESWTSVTGDLPAARVLRTVREDLRNPEVLFVGAELGLFYTPDGGSRWTEIRGGMPTMAINDLVIHPRDNDLVLGTHSRGIWILDDINALQELTPDVRAADAHLFTIEPAYMIQYRSERGHTGDMIFYGRNPDRGVRVDFWLAEGGPVELSVADATGSEIARWSRRGGAGLNRQTWSLRHARPGQREDSPPAGPFVVPGTYTVRLEAAGTTVERPVEVMDDPRIEVDRATRVRWTEVQLEIGALVAEISPAAREAREWVGRVDRGEVALSDDLVAELRDISRELSELVSRTSRLLGGIAGWIGPLSGQEEEQWSFFRSMWETLEPEWTVLQARLPE